MIFLRLLKFILFMLLLFLPISCVFIRTIGLSSFVASMEYAQHSWKIIFLVLGVELFCMVILVLSGSIKIDPLPRDPKELRKGISRRIGICLGCCLFAACYPGIVVPTLAYPFLQDGFSVETRIKEIKLGGSRDCLGGKIVVPEYHSGFLSSFSEGACFDADVDNGFKVGDSVKLVGVGDNSLGLFVKRISKT